MTANSFGSRAALDVAGREYEIYRLDAAEGSQTLPFSLKILLENLLRNEDGANITADHINALAQWDPGRDPRTEIQFTPDQYQPAHPGRAGHRPFRGGRRVRPARRVRQERRDRVRP